MIAKAIEALVDGANELMLGNAVDQILTLVWTCAVLVSGVAITAYGLRVIVDSLFVWGC